MCSTLLSAPQHFRVGQSFQFHCFHVELTGQDHALPFHAFEVVLMVAFAWIYYNNTYYMYYMYMAMASIRNYIEQLEDGLRLEYMSNENSLKMNVANSHYEKTH